MFRGLCLAVSVLCLGGCFLFNNPYENASTPTAQFQIVVKSSLCGGTYVWNPADSAYEATVGVTFFRVSMSSSGTWSLFQGAGQIAYSYTPAFMALPPTDSSKWNPSDKLVSVDDSAAGISAQGSAPDTVITHTKTLQVAFLPSTLGNTATYQWVRCAGQTGAAQTVLGTGPTYTLNTPDANTWIRVIVTPADATGQVLGTAVTSPPVYISG